MRHSRIGNNGVLIVAVITGSGALWSCGRNEGGEAPAQAAPVAVQTAKPERRNVSRLIALPGDVHPWEETTLYAKVPGYLGAISVDKGDHVKAGQIIATIQAPELQADREQAQQAYQSALAVAQGSRATGERTVVEQQRAQSAAAKAQADYAQSPALIARAQAQLKQMQEAVQQAQEQKNQAEASQAEAQAQVGRAQSEVESANADQKLADVTFTRYQGIYDKTPMLIAKQDVDVAESRAKSARGKTLAAQSAVEVAQRHVQAAQAQVNVAASQVAQAQAQVMGAREQVRLAIAQQASAQKQAEVAAQDVAIAGKQQAVTRAKIQETQAQANAGRSALGKTVSVADYARIRAPFSGIVTKRFVDRGAFIQTAAASQNAAPIATIANVSQVRIYVNMPETEARFLQVGTPVKITTSGLPDITFAGRVARASGSLDSKTRALLAEIDLPNTEGKILPGAYATAKVVLETHPNVVSVPSLAVGVEKAGKFVFVVENGKAKRLAVTSGFEDGAYTEIVEGLQGSEQVVVTGRDTLTPGAAVTTTLWTPPAKK